MTSILGFCGSLSPVSINAGLLHAAVEVAPDGIELEIVHVGSLPHYDPSVEDPSVVSTLKAKVVAADALLFATPEYNFGIPGVLKNAIDWLSRPQPSVLERKAVGIVSASPALPGGVRGQLQLRQNLLYNNAFVLPQPQFAVGMSRSKFSPEGVLEDEKTRSKLQVYLGVLAQWAQLVAATEDWPGSGPDERHVF